MLSCEGDRNTPLAAEGYEEKRNERKINTSCGHKKGQTYHADREIDYSLLLNPADADTQNLFSYLDGFISPSDICGAGNIAQVTYTIDRLSLDCEKLNARRNLRIAALQAQLATLSCAEKKIYISRILDLSKEFQVAYYSTIKDNFGYLTL